MEITAVNVKLNKLNQTAVSFRQSISEYGKVCRKNNGRVRNIMNMNDSVASGTHTSIQEKLD